MKKVMLITPPYHSGVVESAGTWLNLGFVYIASSLREAGYDVYLYDAMSYFHDYTEITKRIETHKPDVVATTAITASINDCLEICRLSKEINPAIVTIIGNVHPTFCWEEILKKHHNNVDYIVRGEGELTLPELLDCHFSGGDALKVKGIALLAEDRAVATPSREYIVNLDALRPAWDLVDWEIYSYRPKENSILAIVSSSRGCNQQCSFCSQQLFWSRKWRSRSPENFVSEIEYLHETYGVNVVMMPDETPTFDRIRWEKILDLLVKRRMDVELLMETRVEDIIRDQDILWKYKEAGIAHIYVGVESTSQETLNRFKKDIKVEESRLAISLINKEDIISETSFVLGMPEDTKKSINTTVELAKYYNPDMAFFLAITPWPYAEIYRELEPYIEIKDYSKYNLIEPIVKPASMTINELKDELNRATRLFYMDKFLKLNKMSSFKRDYMLATMRLLMEHSCIAHQMTTVKDSMPEDIRRYIERFAKTFSPIP
ncbi:MAG: cobalamin B12-binding domain-containing protein [Nitrospirae bacterium]|nr:cobalamin B12-binding domain-containing protein [Nitrospirota bacterium]MBI5193525.1 cobalamin B12-binding domain-containing protein [Nitrospirota bacterium]